MSLYFCSIEKYFAALHKNKITYSWLPLSQGIGNGNPRMRSFQMLQPFH
jgi:hypothetical protein